MAIFHSSNAQDPIKIPNYIQLPICSVTHVNHQSSRAIGVLQIYNYGLIDLSIDNDLSGGNLSHFAFSKLTFSFA